MELNRAAPGTVYSFGVYELDVEVGELRKRGMRIRLQTQPMRVLTLLLANAGQVVERDQLQSELWPDDTFVDFDHGLNSAVNKIRQALSDAAANPRFLETVPRQGYRFIAEVQATKPPVVEADAPPVDPPPPEPAPPAPSLTQGRPETPERSGSQPDVDPVRVIQIVLASAVVCALVVFGALRIGAPGPSLPAIGDTGAPAQEGPVRILAGQTGGRVDGEGRLWEGDRYYRGGLTSTRTGAVVGARDRSLFEGERYGSFLYVVPVPPGEYRVTLYFAETWFGAGNPAGGGAGSRRFDVLINGEARLRDVDVYREAGGANRALVKTIDGVEPAADGAIEIAFSPLVQNAMVNAVEVTPGER